MIFPERDKTHRAFDRGSIGRASISRTSVDYGTVSSSPVSPTHPRSNLRRKSEASRHAVSILHFVQAGDVFGLRRSLSKLSPSERDLVFAVDTRLASGCNPVLVAVKLGNLAVVQSILESLSEGQVCSLFYTEADTEDVLTDRILTCPPHFGVCAHKPQSSVV